MKIFYGAAIQGRGDRRTRAGFNRKLIDAIKAGGHAVVTEHTSASTYEEAVVMLEDAFGRLPTKGPERTAFARDRIVEGIASDIDAAIFDVTIPSIGTGIEIAHAYLRPKMGQNEIPILLLFNPSEGFEMSGMIRGLSKAAMPNVEVVMYDSTDDAKRRIEEFLKGIRR